MSLVYQKSSLIGGNFQDSLGNPLSSGYLVWTLSHDSNVTVFGSPTGSQVFAGASVTTLLDQIGRIAGNPQIWANSLLTPSGSYYTVRCFNSQGVEVWASPQIFTLSYLPSIDVGAIQPQTP